MTGCSADHGDRHIRAPRRSTGSYITLWFVFGVGAHLLSAAVESASSRSAWVAMNWGRAGAMLLVLAGVYQLTPLKDIGLLAAVEMIIFGIAVALHPAPLPTVASTTSACSAEATAR